jgi:hypothetical protein
MTEGWVGAILLGGAAGLAAGLIGVAVVCTIGAGIATLMK